MGIPSLNSAILYCVSLYFHISSQETSRHHANITNIPDHRLRKGVYLWPTSLFLTPRPWKGAFFRPPESQSKICLSRESSELRQGCQINWKTALTINSAESCDIFWVISDTAVGKILSNELKSTELCQKIKKYCHSARNINSQINWNL